VYNGYRTQDARSPYGLYDMAGNVGQWVSDITEGMHDRCLLGGSKDSYGYSLRVWTRNSARPDYYSPSVGFRCVRQAWGKKHKASKGHDVRESLFTEGAPLLVAA
jgi:formylglycine-generating enzyme required for sulfatase activity